MHKVIRCRNKEVHRKSGGVGNILFVLDENAIYTMCSDRGCKKNKWWKTEISFPGMKIDLTKAALTQTPMPENFSFPTNGKKDMERMPVVIGGN